MTINDFENHISSTIVSRGKDYFSRKNISTLKEVKRGEWAAEVEGTDTYEVEISLEGEKIEDWSCDCPYDGGDVCKHVVAVLFGIRAKLKIQPVHLSTTTAKNASANSFNDILGKTTIDELRFFVRELTHKDKALENSFLLHFAHYNTQSTTKQYYADILKANFKIRKGRNHSISYRDIEEVMQPVYDLEESFESMMDQELYENVFNIIQAIYEELITYIINLEEPYDDYEDEYDEEHMYTAVSNAVDYLKQIQVSENAPVVLKNEIFNYVLHALKISLYKDNTEIKNALYQAAKYGVNDDEKEKRVLDYADAELKALKNLVAHEWKQEMYEERLLKLKVELLIFRNKTKPARQILLDNLHIIAFRDQIIEENINQANYAAAKKLILEGIGLAISKDKHGLMSTYRTKLLDIAQKENNPDDIRTHANALMGDSFDAKYYRLIKNTYVGDEVREEYIKSLIKDYDTQKSTGESLKQLYIEEEMWDRLIVFAFTHRSRNNLRSVEPYLEKLFPEEMLSLWIKAIDDFAPTVSTRPAYQELANELKHILKYPNAKAKVILLIANYKILHIRKPALQEELNKIKL